MIPSNNVPTQDIVIEKDPNLTYKLNLEDERVRKFTDDIESIKQTIIKILNTERYLYLAYNWQYGIEVNDLIGMPKNMVKALLPERIKEALLTDDRIQDVVDFSFIDIGLTELEVTFTVILFDFENLVMKWRWDNVRRTNGI